MKTFPYIKMELQQLKWAFFGLTVLFLFALLSIHSHLVSELGNWFQYPYQNTAITNYTFAHIPFQIQILYFIIPLVAFLQFDQYNPHFMFSLPITKKTLLSIKIICGMCTYTFGLMIYFTGLTLLVRQNLHWMEASYRIFPEPVYISLMSSQSIASVAKYVLFLWVCATAVYMVSLFIYIVVTKKLLALLFSELVLIYPYIVFQIIAYTMADLFSIRVHSLYEIAKWLLIPNWVIPDYFFTSQISVMMAGQFYELQNGVKIYSIENTLPLAILALAVSVCAVLLNYILFQKPDMLKQKGVFLYRKIIFLFSFCVGIGLMAVFGTILNLFIHNLYIVPVCMLIIFIAGTYYTYRLVNRFHGIENGKEVAAN